MHALGVLCALLCTSAVVPALAMGLALTMSFAILSFVSFSMPAFGSYGARDLWWQDLWATVHPEGSDSVIERD